MPAGSPPPTLRPSPASLGRHNYKPLFPRAKGGTNQTLVSAHRPRPLDRKLPVWERTKPEVPPSYLQTAARTGQSAASTFAVSFPLRSVDPQGDTAARKPQFTLRSHVG